MLQWRHDTRLDRLGPEVATNAPITFGDWLHQRRNALRLTREQLAARVGCSVSALRKLEAGERRPSLQIAELLANALGVEAEARPTFLKVARGELNVDRLPSPGLTTASSGQQRPASPPTPRLNLPTHATPLVGRQVELAELGRLLHEPHCQLLTLVGPGGIGKTRLAVRAARQFGDAFPDGAAFVPLAPLNAARFVFPAIADSVGFRFSGPADPQSQLTAYLSDKRMVLVLDNAEHLLADGAADLLGHLLQSAPGVKLLVTSREVLNLQAEWVFVVQGLPVPDEATGSRPAEGGAVELFLQRAQRAHVGFVPKAEDGQAIARICQLVEGMPLAIELAASWVRVLSCQEIASELERDPGHLAVSARDLPERHRSLRAVFDHSWRLLPEAEQEALMRLSVFRGGFTREAAGQVAGASLAVLSSLLAKSLVRRGATGRYDLHELIRQYAGERLREAGAEERTRQAHAAWFEAYARAANAHLETQVAHVWLNDIEQEHNNIREVLQWSLEPDAVDTGPGRVDTGLRLMCALTDFFFVRGHHHQALAFFEQVLGRSEERGSHQARVEALTQASYFYYVQGRFAEARSALDRAFDHIQALGDPEQLAIGLEYRGLLDSAEGDYPAARSALERSLGLWRELKAGFREAGVLGHLGDIALAQHDFELAERLYTQALDPGGNMPDGVRHPYAPRRLAYLVLRRGECDRAVELACQSLRLNQAIHDSRAMAACLVALASVARVQGQLTRAARLCGAAEAILMSIAASLLPADREEYERTVDSLTRGLSEADLAAAWAEGRALSLTQAIGYALQAE